MDARPKTARYAGIPATQQEGGPGRVVAAPVPVVYLAGVGRSGSTLLDRLLGEVPGWWSLGEVVHLWDRGLVRNERCGCGDRFWDCAVWRAIGREAFGGWERVDPLETMRLRASVERDRWTFHLLAPDSQRRFARRMAQWHQLLAALYRGALAATGSTVLVDSSKHTSTAIGLRHSGDVDLHVVHLIRDSRGVAYSWAKSVARPAADSHAAMARWSPWETSLRYTTYNALLAGVFGPDRMRVRYEDLVADPGTVVDRVVANVTGHATGLPFLRRVDGEVVADLGVSHGISGNPMRAQAGRVTVRLDQEWTLRLSRMQRWEVTAMTLPVLVANGYRVQPGSEMHG